MSEVRTLPLPDGLDGLRLDVALSRLLGMSRTTLIKRLESYGYVRPRKGQDDD